MSASNWETFSKSILFYFMRHLFFLLFFLLFVGLVDEIFYILKKHKLKSEISFQNFPDVSIVIVIFQHSFSFFVIFFFVCITLNSAWIYWHSTFKSIKWCRLSAQQRSIKTFLFDLSLENVDREGFIFDLWFVNMANSHLLLTNFSNCYWCWIFNPHTLFSLQFFNG